MNDVNEDIHVAFYSSNYRAMAASGETGRKRGKRGRADITRDSHEVSKKRHTSQLPELLNADDDGEPVKKGFTVWKSNLLTRKSCDKYALPFTDSSGKHFTPKSLCIGSIVEFEEEPLVQKSEPGTSSESPEQTDRHVYVKLHKAAGKLKERMGFRIRATHFLNPMEALCLLDYGRLKLIHQEKANDEEHGETFCTFKEAYIRLLQHIDDFRLYRVYYDLFSRGYALRRLPQAHADPTVGSFALHLKRPSKSSPSNSLQYLVIIVDGEQDFPPPQWFASLTAYEEPLMLAVVSGAGASIVYMKSNFESLGS
eukprot:gb/GECG01007138.1/.p1 GENE.gb/GECG01007138.1/~~gb/GECG01007138.1/.p1  ORF type:complete len:311 (+),score=39.77 gb/GECG01007138.1/:1-933(+)